MKPELEEAFKMARYEVLSPRIEFKVGRISVELNKLLDEHQCYTWAFITPFNPGSQIISYDENEERLDILRKDVSKYVTFDGRGGGQAEGWPLEKSLLVLGISLRNAKKIGADFGQDAIVFGYKNRPPEIVTVRKI